MKKSTALIVLLLLLGVMTGFGYMLMYGIDERGSGAFTSTSLGLDLAGGVSITYEVIGEEKPSEEDLADTIYKLRRRIDKYSTEAQVYKEGDNRISIEIPGVTDAEAVLSDLGSPGSLYFIRSQDASGNMNYERKYTREGQEVYQEGEVYFAATGEGTCVFDLDANAFALDEAGNKIAYTIQDSSKVETVFVLTKPIEDIVAEGSAVLSGTDVASSKALGYVDDYNVTQHVVSLTFKEEAAQIFSDETAVAAMKPGLAGTIAIYYDGELISVPNVSSRIAGGEAQISGMSSAAEAEQLAQSIRIGGLKLELQELRSNVVGAQLGTDAIKTSVQAAIVGLLLVIIFMVAVYRIPGLASSIALVIYVMMTMLCINFMGITMTLPGIAGIILSIGMAVDANVIIFARIREEIAEGLTVETAIKNGFSKALSAIVDGNITTLIAALVLIAMGSGSIKGFAYTLALGIILSMFTALFITRLLLNCLYALGIQNVKFYGVAKKGKTLNVTGKRKIYLTISSALIAIGFLAMIVAKATTGTPLNFSLEFMGGTATTVAFDAPMEREAIEKEIIPQMEAITGDAGVQWTTVNNSNEVIFKTAELSMEERQEFVDFITATYGIEEGKITTESISSTISSEMQRDAIIAVLIASVCMLIYIWMRFSDVRFGASAVIALLHDVLVVLAFYAVVRLSVGSTFIACMLTIVGYSINATIVIFDRIRENIKGMRKKDTLEDMVNTSVSQTLSRSLFTSLTTFIMVAVLYVMGVSSIKEFALPLMIGILSGTYSSIFLTGSIWNMLRNRFPQEEEDD